MSAGSRRGIFLLLVVIGLIVAWATAIWTIKDIDRMNQERRENVVRHP